MEIKSIFLFIHYYQQYSAIAGRKFNWIKFIMYANTIIDTFDTH